MEAGTTPGGTRTDADASRQSGGGAPDGAFSEETPPSVLDRVIPLGGATSWQTLGWIAAFVVALALRLLRLDQWALDAGEAAWAYDAWVLYRGQPSIAGEALPNAGPLLLLLEGIAFFLFGATDVIARLVPVLAGLTIVALPLTLRRWVGAPAALGMAALAAISPALVFASRVVSPEILIAALALAAVACLVHLGESGPFSARPGAVALGVVAGAAYATGPSAVSVALTLAIGIALAAIATPEDAIRRGLRALRAELPAFLLSAVATAALCFMRFLSDPAGITGAGETLVIWWRFLAGAGSGQPVQLFLLALLIYEPIAIVFAAVALARDNRRDAVALCAAWAAAAFALWSFSAGRGPEHAVHVALPLVLLAGIGLGSALHQIDWREVWHGSAGLLALAMLGILVGVAAAGILLIRAIRSGAGAAAALPAVAVLCLVVVPLVYVVWRLSGDERLRGRAGQPALIAALVVALLLGGFGLRSAILLSFARADLGTELLAQHKATLGTLLDIESLFRLARDVGVGEGSARDPTGSHSLRIALERDVQWPYVWYFREFPDLTLAEPGAGATAAADVVIAAAAENLSGAGYTVETRPWLTTVPPHYLQPDMGSILGALVNPSRWLEVWRYLLFRDGIPPPAPATVAVGFAPELAARVTPRAGPYDLGDRPGPGAEPGQFADPIGVAVEADGIIAVVDSGNARVQRFDRDGAFLGIWGEGEAGVTFTRTENGLGPTGITIAPDGSTWVADTWGHRVVALDADGAIAHVIGGETIDTGNDPARVDEAGGRFFGPRDIAVSDAAIYVIDTGNERVQQFTSDGVFVDAWGGYGSSPDQLIEPVGIAIGPDGNLYVADSGNARISIFTPAGQPVAQWSVEAWPAPEPGGLPPAYQPYLAFDDDGNLYATASNAGQVVVFNREGTLLSRISEAGDEQLSQPIGVAIAPDGEVLFTDVGRDAVLTYDPPDAVSAGELDVEDAGASPGS
jgi:DNA-binding beta-propeller fold protein YncE